MDEESAVMVGSLFILVQKGSFNMNITEIKLTDIKPYERNQKKHPDTQINNIATSIDKYGFIQPLVLSSENEIVIGHGRYLAAKKLNMETVPCVYAENLSEEKIKELRILDNKLNESEWDMELLKQELEELDFSEFDIDFEIALEEAEADYMPEPMEEKDAPEEFKEYGEDIETKCKCPKCGYEW